MKRNCHHHLCGLFEIRRYRIPTFRLIVIFLLLLLINNVASQEISLIDYLPYDSNVSSTLISNEGLVMSVIGHENGIFSWVVGGNGTEGLRQTLRRSDQGLTYMKEERLHAWGSVSYTESMTEPLLVLSDSFPALHTQTFNGSYLGQETGFSWRGEVEGVTSSDEFEFVETPFGPFKSLKIRIRGQWQETGAGYSGHGTTTQTWWLGLGIGLTQFDYESTETNTEENGESETEHLQFRFRLKEGDLLKPPFITLHPSSTSVMQGAPLTLQVEAQGVEPLNYRWYRDGEPISQGGLQSSFTVANVTEDDAGNYHVVVSNVFGESISHPARVEFMRIEPVSLSFNLVPADGVFALTWIPDSQATSYKVWRTTNFRERSLVDTVSNNPDFNKPLTIEFNLEDAVH